MKNDKEETSTSKDKYVDSWALYKAHSEVFTDDLQYYLEFTKNHRTLDMFAGYGRITNFLQKNGVNVEAVELNPELAKQIQIPKELSHVGDVLTFSSEEKYSRIIAGYNSFCLFTNPDDIRKFFKNLSSLLTIGGQVSLNYYSTNNWADAVAYEFSYQGQTVQYIPEFDLSKKADKIGIWIDNYEINKQKIEHKYEVRVYEGQEDILPFVKDSGLKLIRVVNEFGLPSEKILEPGWIDYVFEKVE